MIKRIHIKGFKSLADVEVHLQPLSVLFGQNASGKSNFLHALRFLSGVLSADSLTNTLGHATGDRVIELFTIGSDGFAGLKRKKRLRFSMEVDVHLSDAIVHDINRGLARTFSGRGMKYEDIPRVRERDLRYRLEIELRPQYRTARVADEYLAVLNADGEPTADYQPFIERQGDVMHLRPEYEEKPIQFGHNLDRPLLSKMRHSNTLPHAAAVRRELDKWLDFHFEPKFCMRETYHTGAMAKGAPVDFTGDELASYIDWLKVDAPERFEKIGEVVRRLIPHIDDVDVLINADDEYELAVKENGEFLPAEKITDGTFHLVGLLGLPGTIDAPSLVGLEEPESGIYPGSIPAIAELLMAQANLGRTQYIVTTHSPILPDYVPEECLLVVRRVDGQTRIDPIAPEEPERNGSAVGDAIGDARGEGHAGMRVSERILRGDFDA